MGEHKKRSKKAAQQVEDQPSVDASPTLKKEKKEKSDKKHKTEKKEKKQKKAKAEAPVVEEEEPESKVETAKKEKKEKKRKRTDDDEVEITAPIPNGSSEKPAHSATKEKKKKKTKDDTADSSSRSAKKLKKSTGDPTPKQAEAEPESRPEDDIDGQLQHPDGKNARFICFIGNLPYTATANAVRAHFASLEPTDVRLLTHKDNPTKSRGIAFVEFGRYDRMKTCLEKFHHSEFNDNVSPARKINVELTAGGGGKTAARKDKIKAKNHKLNEERVRRMQDEEAAKLAREKKKGEEKGDAPAQERNEADDIHPSRRGWVPHRR